MDGATADDMPPVVASEWSCCSPPYLRKGDPHFHHKDARTERRVREASGILVPLSQVESSKCHTLTRWAYIGTAPRRAESTPAAAILATQWVLKVVGVWFASARTKGYLWHLPAAIVWHLVRLRLANVAEGADPDAHAFIRELLDLHQALDWEAAGPHFARRVGGEEGQAPRAFVHCDKRQVAGRIGPREGLGDLA